MNTLLLGTIAVACLLIARNTWRSARATMGFGNPVWWRLIWWALGDAVNRIRPGTF